MESCTLIAPRLVDTQHHGVQLEHQAIPNMNGLIGIGVNRANQVRLYIISKKPTIRIRYLGALAGAPRHLFVF